MVKKIQKSKPKKYTRTSSMEKTIAQGEDFVKSYKKRILKTKTMAETLKVANNLPKGGKKFGRPKAVPLGKVVPKILSKKKIVPKRSVPKKKTVIKTKSAKSFSSGDIKKADREKKTVFKTKSKSNLPLPAFGFIDVCFCVDATGSMSGQLAQVQSTIISIIKKIEQKVRTQGITLRFAVVTYRDHPPQDSSYVTKIHDFTDETQIIAYVQKLSADGGGDQPQAIHDGLLDSCNKLNWVELPGTPTLRYIFHVADAPPHGKQFNTGEAKEGCLCGLQTPAIIHAINMKQIHYRLIKARNNPRVDIMESIFKKGIVNFDSADISVAKEMDVRVSDMIIHQILPDHF